MNTKDGGPAFPEIYTDEAYDHSNDRWKSDTYSCGGMSLRDYFAAKAMQALIGVGATLQIHRPDGVLTVPARDAVPNLAYEYADLMLRARAPKDQP